MPTYAVTANRLRDGAVVYFTPDRAWSDDIADCLVSDGDGPMEASLAEARADETACLVVGAYAIAVERQGGAVRPVAGRERIRAFGPTVPAGTDGASSVAAVAE